MSRRSNLFTYGFADDADRRREGRLGRRWLPMTVGILASLAFIVITIVNLFASGVPDPLEGSSAWQSDQPFPLIPLHSWLTVPVGCLPLLTVVLIWRLVDDRHGSMVTNTLAHTLTIFLILPVLFALMYTEPSPFRDGDVVLGWHWLAVPLVLVAAVLLVIRRSTLPASSAPAEPVDPFFEEEVELRRRARYDKRRRERLDQDLAALHRRRNAAAGDSSSAPGARP